LLPIRDCQSSCEIDEEIGSTLQDTTDDDALTCKAFFDLQSEFVIHFLNLFFCLLRRRNKEEDKRWKEERDEEKGVSPPNWSI
jgi:hypothetical protein